MLSLLRTDATHPDFIELVKKLDAFLAQIDGEEHAFYARLNKTDMMKQVVVAYEDDKPAGCGAIRAFDSDAMEIKRMYTLPECRGRGVATGILNELEKWAGELDYKKCVLETGKRQPEAISLYRKSRYNQIPNYGKYTGVENSICFEKKI
jgi:GNAT superfamily N-acetyltransferase